MKAPLVMILLRLRWTSDAPILPYQWISCLRLVTIPITVGAIDDEVNEVFPPTTIDDTRATLRSTDNKAAFMQAMTTYAKT